MGKMHKLSSPKWHIVYVLAEIVKVISLNIFVREGRSNFLDKSSKPTTTLIVLVEARLLDT